ncbi:Oxidoreductase molybdopterin binding domain [Serratia rubidaea]|uniref:Oxidoreductase molybdopterin binding domain n=1 Tax=Serratia rubidaea TaxID=61652 RepID=A0A4U9HWQ6_SERRU|nr:molybdopterin-dependent oxidoreductase [Serratia rubidaea]MBS0974708.1 molybdopterin-dependent oxidoreductase [Serratia rubidaea]QPR64793.1 molybdopterin-dependent oxidoreductase [Serratia rubidaea]UJD82330.1 molybdopterin-dependent oxidoreductase [Serratia rubidaea]UJD86894.1 molybdopterin-dependent oxidoreductase [Serratia rubidaea]CAI1116398.1 Oxidoreductase molybdopterin binding domain [Serratia rubidaea]
MLSTLIRTLALALFALIAAQTSALAFTLEVSGNISHYTDAANKRYVFSDRDLFAMPVHSISTSTSWTPRRKFDGVAVADILKKVGAKGQTLSMHALNDYYIDIPLSDVEHYNIILAYKMDGEMLKIRNFGPLFLVYPRDDSGPELNSPLYNSRFIWQVNRIVIK